MRVALFAPHYAEYTARMALELAKSEKVLLLLDEQNRRNELQDSLFEAVKRATSLFHFRTHTRIGRRLSRVTIVARILLFRPDVVHVQEQPDQLTAIVIGVLRRFFPIVLTVHDPKPHSGRDADYAMRWNRYRERIRQAASVYHVNGPYCAGLMAEAGLPGRPIVDTLHGVILVPDPGQATAPERRRILFFGRMEQYKGLDVLLNAVRELLGRGTSVDLVLAGRGPELDRLQTDIEDLPGVTVLNRYLKPSEAIDEFQRAACVVIPYLEATQSGVVAAAFANGRPVVATRVGGLVDVVQDGGNGLFILPGSVPLLVDALDRLLRDDALFARLTRGAVETGLTTLSWSGVTSRLLEGYRQALAIRRSR